MTQLDAPVPPPGDASPDARVDGFVRTLSVEAARNLATTTKTSVKTAAITPRLILRLLPWVDVPGGTYRLNRRKLVLQEAPRIRIDTQDGVARIDAASLRELPLFRNVELSVVAQIASMLAREEAAAGHVVLSQGDAGGKFYFIVQGKVEVSTTGVFGQKVPRRLLSDGDYFGEMALLSELPRSATVTTVTPCVFLSLDRAQFDAAVGAAPGLRERLAQTAEARRLSDLTADEHGEQRVESLAGHMGEVHLPETYVNYEEDPREYPLSIVQSVLRIHTRVSDLYNHPIDQLAEQLRLTIESIKESQENELINNPSFGLLHEPVPSMRIPTRLGPPTPDDFDELLALVWKQPAFFLAHPKAIAAFGRECTRRGVPPPTVELFGSPFLTWRGVPIIPCDKLRVDPLRGTTNILLMRVGEQQQGVVGLHQTGVPGEHLPSLAVRFMGIDDLSIASYLVTAYFSCAVLIEDALAVLEQVDVSHYYDYGLRA